jgi:hypothetical protein
VNDNDHYGTTFILLDPWVNELVAVELERDRHLRDLKSGRMRKWRYHILDHEVTLMDGLGHVRVATFRVYSFGQACQVLLHAGYLKCIVQLRARDDELRTYL